MFLPSASEIATSLNPPSAEFAPRNDFSGEPGEEGIADPEWLPGAVTRQHIEKGEHVGSPLHIPVAQRAFWRRV